MKIKTLLRDASGLARQESALQLYRAVGLMLRQDGERITDSAVKKWVERNELPSRRLVSILQAAQRRGRNLDLKNYI